MQFKANNWDVRVNSFMLIRLVREIFEELDGCAVSNGHPKLFVEQQLQPVSLSNVMNSIQKSWKACGFQKFKQIEFYATLKTRADELFKSKVENKHLDVQCNASFSILQPPGKFRRAQVRCSGWDT